MICAPMSVSGFSSTGFMSVCGSTPAACACSAWARPISPPSTVTAALLDMFCGLKGSTRRPRRVAARASPATISDLPTSEPAPWIMRARGMAGSLELDTGLSLDAGPEGVLHQRHLGDEIGNVDQLLLGIAAGEHDMRHLRFRCLQEIDDLVHVEVIVAQRDIDLVEHDHAQACVADQRFRFLPACPRGGDVAGAVLRFPGKAFAHRVELAELAEMRGQQPSLAGIPGALDELHDRTGKAVRDAAQDHAEGGGGFSLSRAGMDDDQALLAALSGHDLVARCFLPGHFGGVAGLLRILFGNHTSVPGSDIRVAGKTFYECQNQRNTGNLWDSRAARDLTCALKDLRRYRSECQIRRMKFSCGLTRSTLGQMVGPRWFLSHDRRRGNAIGLEV